MRRWFNLYVVGFSGKSSFGFVDIVTCTVNESLGQVISVCVAIERGICFLGD